MQLFIKDKNFYKKTAIIAIPVILQSIINLGVNLTDTIMLGSFGEVQISASSLANQYYFLFNIFCFGLGGGAAVMTAQYWGKQEVKNIKKVITFALITCFVVALIFTVITSLFPGQIMSVYSEDQAVIDAGIKYFRFLALAFIFHGLGLIAVIILRTVGVVRLALAASCISFGLNIFFNWIFIFGKLGAPRLEIGGAAVGTLIARICEFAIIFVYLFVIDKKIKYKIRDLFAKCSDITKSFVHMAAPVIISDIILALGNNAVAVIIGRMGKEMVTANAIITITVQISTMFIMGLSSASGVVTGNTVGEGNSQKAQQQGVTFLSISTIIGIFAGVFIWLCSPYIISFYNITESTRIVATQLMNAVAFIVVFQAVSMVMTKGVLRGGGDTKFLMYADVLFLWIVSVPLGYLTGLVFKMSPAVVYTCLKIDMVIKSVWCIFRLSSRKWIRHVR